MDRFRRMLDSPTLWQKLLPTLGVILLLALLVNSCAVNRTKTTAQTGKTKATQAQVQSGRANRKSNTALAVATRQGKCILNSKSQEAFFRCINLSLPTPQKGKNGQAGQAGPKGPVGKRGPTGPKGDTGDRGAVGKQGDPGSPCLASVDPKCVGPQGDKGDAGPTGSSGERGPKGDLGATGPKGDTGADGPQGPKGDTGATGADGPAGPAGAPGATGATGAQGPPGPPIASFTFTFVDGAGVQITLTCTDPEGDLTYTCA